MNRRRRHEHTAAQAAARRPARRVLADSNLERSVCRPVRFAGLLQPEVLMLFRRSRRVRNALILSAGLLLSTSLTGCFGRFPAVSSIYNFNKTATSNRVLQSLLMAGLLIIPVYEVGGLVDVLGLNVIDFFSGTEVASKAKTLADGSTVELTRIDADTVRVEHVDAAGKEHAFEVVRVGDKAGYVRHPGGRVIGMAEELPDGQVVTSTP
jgi:hypothetical protein